MFVGVKENFEEAGDVYFQLDNLINNFDQDNTNNITLGYSALSHYDEIQQAYNLAWPTNYFDFLPSTDNDIRYFTGLFTSRPMTKSYIRYASRTLQANSKLFAMKMLDPTTTDTQIATYLNSSRILGESISQALNSDGVAGTSHRVRTVQIVKDLIQAVS
jgi:hypothetical protein